MPTPTSTPTFPSRLPAVGTTIFSVMSALATEHSAVNLGKVFLTLPAIQLLLSATERALRAGHNQYAPMPGLLALREAVAQKIAAAPAATARSKKSPSPPGPPRPS